jgi:chaperonin GroES
MATLKPLGQRLLVEFLDAPEKSAGGIYIPDSAKEKPQEAIVKELGTGARNELNELIPFDVAVGDKVLVSRYGASKMLFRDKEYFVVGADEVIAIIHE